MRDGPTVTVSRTALVDLLCRSASQSILLDDNYTVGRPEDTWAELVELISDLGFEPTPAEWYAFVVETGLAFRWHTKRHPDDAPRPARPPWFDVAGDPDGRTSRAPTAVGQP